MRAKWDGFHIFTENHCCMPIRVTPMVCTFNLCSPPTKKNIFENFRKTGKEQDWLKKKKTLKMALIFAGQNGTVYFFFNNSKSYRAHIEYEPAK